MKRSRIGIRKKRKKTNIIIVLLFLFILPVIAVIIGSKITEWWVIPTINTDDILGLPDETVSEEGGKVAGDAQDEINGADHTAGKKGSDGETVNLNSISIYMIQVASISDNKNTESLIEELGSCNLPHVIYKSGDAYKVYTFVSTDRGDIEDKIDRVREIYEDAYMGQMHIPQKQVQYLSEENKGTKEFIEDMNSLLELLKQSSDSLYSSDSEETKLNAYKGILEKHQKLLGQMLEKVDKTNLPEDFANADDVKKMIEYQEKNITESLKIIEKKQELYKLQSYLSDNLFRVAEVIKK